jgi:hypothetical protein
VEVKDIIRQLQPETNTVLQLVKEMDGDKPVSKIVVEQRRLNAEAPRHPIRSESKPRQHEFFEAKSFVSYLSKYGNVDTVIFANPDKGTMRAVLDEQSEVGYEIVSCDPMLHPLWKPWEQLVTGDQDADDDEPFGNSIPLERFVRFLMQNRRVVVDGRGLVMELSQVSATTTVQLQRGRGKNAINGLMVTTKIQGQEATNLVELPDSITLTVPIFVGTSPKTLTLDLTIDVVVNGTGVVVSLSSGDLLAAKFEAFEEMFKAMAALTEKGMTVTMGRPEHGAWEYLKEGPVAPAR